MVVPLLALPPEQGLAPQNEKLKALLILCGRTSEGESRALWPAGEWKSMFRRTEDDWPSVQIIFKCLQRIISKRGAEDNGQGEQQFREGTRPHTPSRLPWRMGSSLPGAPTGIPLALSWFYRLRWAASPRLQDL